MDSSTSCFSARDAPIAPPGRPGFAPVAAPADLSALTPDMLRPRYPDASTTFIPDANRPSMNQSLTSYSYLKSNASLSDKRFDYRQESRR
jgi:hypothetical protein